MRRKLKNSWGFTNILDFKKFDEEVKMPLRKGFIGDFKNVKKSVYFDDWKKYEVWMSLEKKPKRYWIE